MPYGVVLRGGVLFPGGSDRLSAQLAHWTADVPQKLGQGGFLAADSTLQLLQAIRGRSSFSWEYGIGYILQRRSAWYEPRGEAIASPRGSYFSAAALGTRTSARGIFSTPSYPDKAGSPCVLKPITIFRLT